MQKSALVKDYHSNPPPLPAMFSLTSHAWDDEYSTFKTQGTTSVGFQNHFLSLAVQNLATFYSLDCQVLLNSRYQELAVIIIGIT